MSESTLTHQRVLELFSYDPETGVLLRTSESPLSTGIDWWLCGAATPTAPGGVVKVNGRNYPPVKLIWFIYYGEWPKGKVRPRDRDVTNRRILNLYANTKKYLHNRRMLALSTTQPGYAIPITHERVLELFNYTPDTGAITRRIQLKKGFPAGSVVGVPSRDGAYGAVSVEGKPVTSGRFVWFYMTGEWPEGWVDHSDHDRGNNKWDNLRDIAPQENSKNLSLPTTNKSGLYGVCYLATIGKWRAYIDAFGKTRNLGTFDNLFDAACVRKRMEHSLGYYKNHGRA